MNFAPRNERGQVEFVGDLFILAPADLSKSCGAALYDVNNRGNKLALRFFNFAPGGNNPQEEKDLGDGFLLRQGFIVLWSGWDGELLPGLLCPKACACRQRETESKTVKTMSPYFFCMTLYLLKIIHL